MSEHKMLDLSHAFVARQYAAVAGTHLTIALACLREAITSGPLDRASLVAVGGRLNDIRRVLLAAHGGRPTDAEGLARPMPSDPRDLPPEPTERDLRLAERAAEVAEHAPASDPFDE